jgi:hypothetical protein
MWRGGCYTSENELGFYISKLTEEEEIASVNLLDRPQVLKVWGRRAKSEGDYLMARDGDSAVIPFECDLCIFQKLTKKIEPIRKNPQHGLLMAAIPTN